jgi:hypothetical protein
MSAGNIVFDLVYKETMPTTVEIMKYTRRNMSIDDDRWGSIYEIKDLFRVLIKLKVI